MTPRILARSLVALGVGALGACSTGMPPAAEAPVRAKATDHLEGLEPDIYEPELTTTTEPAAETTTTTFAAGAGEEQIAGTFDTPVEIPENSVARSTVVEPVDEWAIPTYVVMCESMGRNVPNSEGSGASGFYQITDGTWDGYGGYNSAMDAPKEVQDAKAADLYQDGAGASHWQACL